jgi:hypothetical protein
MYGLPAPGTTEDRRSDGSSTSAADDDGGEKRVGGLRGVRGTVRAGERIIRLRK